MRTVAKDIQTLSRGLTRDRRMIGTSYLDDPRLLRAYLLYFWPVSYAQTRAVLESSGLHVRNALDLGAGPGPSSIALFDGGALKVTACERSREALRIAEQIAKSLRMPLTTHLWNVGEPLPEGIYDCILISHLLNELWSDDDEKLAKRVEFIARCSRSLSNDGFLLIIEPALLSTSRELLSLKGPLEKAGLSVISPCFYEGPCPALEKPEGTCHAEFAWNPPPLITRLSHAARIGKESLKVTYLLLSRVNARENTEGMYRVVSDPMLSKNGRIRYLLCGQEGRISLSAPKDIQAQWMRSFKGLQRGDIISFSKAERRENGYGLTEKSTLLHTKISRMPLPMANF